MILITNDDGIIAPGIKALIEVASGFGEVLVVAPDAPQSGQGHAITITRPVKLRKVDLYNGITAYECSGTPVDCVKLAKNVLLKNQKIDLCVSGINHGSNASINILYSGTMSAAMEASLEGINSIGFSLSDYSFDADFSLAKKYAEVIIRDVLMHKLNDCRLLNVNIPAGQDIKGIKVCRQARGRWIEEFKEGIDPRGEKYYWLTGKFEYEDHGEDTDIYALENNFVSVVPSGFDLTAYPALNSLKRMENLI
ncbi:MAG: 5'/3'-nucleotidase SurE [Saprospiraceae bacterium]|nr:5'/3'-nucleotidase SurE [Saprospiraceae bacterium]MBK6565744.1 5'/3'-nucleotidase SurE [Saprospiraceae bacterium]MBK7525220.1 5'/3'-nucleotidase SurE [Saprospiraceae bacterium]MBK8082168.1 5'/3'-nucleotidase SurE [Saprospiraceae bacterium]MBK8370244.1 5'/3'-nucleotidase SurE [Saprospiraceae bacterium]